MVGFPRAGVVLLALAPRIEVVMTDGATWFALALGAAFAAAAIYGHRRAKQPNLSDESRHRARIGKWTAIVLAVFVLYGALKHLPGG